MRPMSIEDIGFGETNRKFTAGGQTFTRGMEIPLSVLKAMPSANRNALIENRMISVYPKSVTLRSLTKSGKAIVSAAQEPVTGELHIVAKGFGKFDVIRGTVEAKGLTREDADAFVAAASVQTAAPAADAQEATAATPGSAPQRSSATRRKKSGRKRRPAGRRAPAAPQAPAPGDPPANGPIEE